MTDRVLPTKLFEQNFNCLGQLRRMPLSPGMVHQILRLGNAERILVVWRIIRSCGFVEDIFLNKAIYHIIRFIKKQTKQLIFSTFPRSFTHLNVWTRNNQIANLDVGADATRIFTLAREPQVLVVSLPSCSGQGNRFHDWMV